MNARTWAAIAAATIASATPALADYETHPEIMPSRRCVTEDGTSFAAAGIDARHCLRLFWDIPAATRVGFRAAAAVFTEDPIPQWPRGLTDRVPPMYAYDPDKDGVADDCPANDPYYGQFDMCGDGVPDGFETAGPNGAYSAENPAGDRYRLCANPDDIPWWRPIWADASGNEVAGKKGQPLIGHGEGAWAEGGLMGQRQGHVHEVSCRRGSRSSLGPWQVGTNPGAFDEKASPQQLVRFENTERLDRDAARGLFPDGKRYEWNDGTEFYNHFASHHGVCYQMDDTCNSAQTAQAVQPGGSCWNYQKAANSPAEKAATDPAGTDPNNGGCYSSDQYANSCQGKVGGSGAFRNATQIPGRLYVEFPEGRAMHGFEDQLWSCDHHVVHQLPPGSYGLTQLADYRQMKGGVLNERASSLYGAPQGAIVGGSVGEMIMQYFTLPIDEEVRPVNIMFNAAPDLATTMYPPYTWNYHTTLWTPPFDALTGLYVIHSHHRMVKGQMDILPSNPLRPNSPNPLCGGSKNGVTSDSVHMYTGWYWEDAYPCEYWKDPDGPLPIRKGQTLQTTCYVNNGVTPEAIKHGLVGSSVVESLKLLGAPIPDYPKIGPASAWGDALVQSPAGRELLYGTHEPVNYRVVYKCAATPAPFTSTIVSEICNPNPAVDSDGDYIDGPYRNPQQCPGSGNVCEPSSIMFQCRGEDEMCIGVAIYWAMDRIGDVTGKYRSHDQAMDNVTSGDPERIQQTGTPGNVSALGRSADVVGICPECETVPEP